MNPANTIITTNATITTTTSFSTNTNTILNITPTSTSPPRAVNGVEVAAVILELVLEHRGGGEEGQVPEGGQVQGEGAERPWCRVAVHVKWLEDHLAQTQAVALGRALRPRQARLTLPLVQIELLLAAHPRVESGGGEERRRGGYEGIRRSW